MTSLVSVVGLIYTKGDIEVLYIAAICGLFLQVGILEYNLHIFNYVSFKYYDKTLLNLFSILFAFVFEFFGLLVFNGIFKCHYFGYA